MVPPEVLPAEGGGAGAPPSARGRTAVAETRAMAVAQPLSSPQERDPDVVALVTETINDWLSQQRSPATVKTYADAVGRVTAIVPYAALPYLDLGTVRMIVAAMGRKYSPATVSVTVWAMSRLWGELQARGVVRGNPWKRLKMRKPKDNLAERLLTEEEVKRILDAAGEGRDGVFMRFLYKTGLRIEEACTVTWEDMHWDDKGRCWLTVYGKGGKTRTVRVPADVVADLLRLWSDRPTRGRIWEFHVRTGERIVEKYRGVVGKPVSPHWFRHARATHAFRRGAPIDLVQRTLGHASVQTTMRYLHAMPGSSDADYLPDL